MSLAQLRDEHEGLEKQKQLREVRARLQNKRLLHEVLALSDSLQQTIGVMRQCAAPEGAVLRSWPGTKFQLLSGQSTYAKHAHRRCRTDFLRSRQPLVSCQPSGQGYGPT
jgi:hypothetical protein